MTVKRSRARRWQDLRVKCPRCASEGTRPVLNWGRSIPGEHGGYAWQCLDCYRHFDGPVFHGATLP